MQTLLQSAFLQSLGWAILQSTWQITLLWAAYFLITRGFLRHQYGARIFAALSTISLGFIWFMVSFFQRLTQSDPATYLVTKERDWYTLLDQFTPWVSSAYLILLLAGVFRFAGSFRYVRDLQKNEHIKIPYEWRLFTARTAAIIGIRRKVSIWLSDFSDSPVTVGFLKPMILIPVSMLNQLSVPQMEAIILHELAHIKRNDYLVNLILTILEGLLFFHPFIKLIGKDIRKNREFMCDDLVLQFKYHPSHYAAALLQAEKNRIELRQNQLQMAATGEKEALMERVSRITDLDIQKKRTSFRPLLAFFFMILIGFFATRMPMLKEKALFEADNDSGEEYSMTISSFLPENRNRMKAEAVDTEELSAELYADSHQTETEIEIMETETVLQETSEAWLEAREELAKMELAYVESIQPSVPAGSAIQTFPVSDKEIALEIDGVEWIGKAFTSPGVAAENKPITITITADSNAVLTYNHAEGIQMELGSLQAMLEKLNWEKIAHEEAKGAETIALLQQEIADMVKSAQWEQFKESAEKMSRITLKAQVEMAKADSLAAQLRAKITHQKKKKITIHL